MQRAASGSIQRNVPLLVALSTDVHFPLPFPNLQILDSQTGCFADSQTCLQKNLHDRVVAARQCPAGLTGSAQQRLNLGSEQAPGASTTRHPRDFQTSRHIAAQFAGAVCPAAEAAQGFELSIHAGRLQSPLTA